MTRYELLERIGSGGMAEIFRARAIAAGGFEKPVAIKRILPHLSLDQRFVELLIAEAKLLSQLRHRNIVQIFDVGLGQDGQYFLVMEMVEGADLGGIYDRLEARRKRLPLGLALHIGAEVCDALEFAHQACSADGTPMHLVHRDVSPTNILLSRSGEVKLTDFGIAKHAEEATGHGAVRGKFAYISPEQATNDRVDPRSDVYSLGIVLYELVLGHRLFSGGGEFEALQAVRRGDIRPLTDIDPNLSPELEGIIMTALAKDPAHRYASAAQFGSKLRGFRYSLPQTGSDPAQEMARILEKMPNAGDPEGREPTVVNLQTAVGFPLEPGTFDETGSFDETGDLHLSANDIDSRFDSDGDDDMSGEVTRLLHRSGGALAMPAPAETLDLVIPHGAPREATPTVQDVFYGQRMMSSATPTRVNHSTEPVPRQSLGLGRRPLMLWLMGAAIAVGLASFVVAGNLLSESAAPHVGRTDAGAGADADAAEAADAGSKSSEATKAAKKTTPEKKSARTRKKTTSRKKKASSSKKKASSSKKKASSSKKKTARQKSSRPKKKATPTKK